MTCVGGLICVLKDEELRDNHVLASAESGGWNYIP